MKRWHLFEIHDQSWCPDSLRNALTRLISHMTWCFRTYSPTADLLADALDKTGDTQVFDLCSGSGGPWRKLLGRVRNRLQVERQEPLRVFLTDKYPTDPAVEFPEGLSYVPDSVDAMAMGRDRAGFRTMFTSFHHFEPDGAQAILADAVRNGSGIAVFECTRRKVSAVLLYLLAPVLVWFTVPFLRPFRWQDWAWTYPIPILPMVVLFDGLVSCLRTYSPEACLELAAAADSKGEFEWEAGVKWSLPHGMTYLIGRPRHPKVSPP